MKASKIIAIVIWSLVAILLTVFLVAAINFNGDGIGFIGWSNDFNYEPSDGYSIGDFEISDIDSIKKIDLNWVNGNVYVEMYDGDAVKCTESATEKEDDRMRWTVQDGELKIQFRKWKAIRFSFFGSGGNKDVHLLIPKKLVRLEDLDINSVSANINADGVSCAEFNLECVSGRAELNNIDADIISVDTNSGDTEIDGSVAAIHADMVSGDLRVKSGVMPSEIELNSVSGNAVFEIAEGDGFAASFDSVSGDFECDFSTVKNGKKYTAGDGSGVYSFDTVSGDVTVNKLK